MVTGPIRGLAYSENGTLHAIPWDGEMWVDAYLGERVPAFCGGGFPNDKPLHKVSGLMLSDAKIKGHLCDECLEAMRKEEITVPGFIVDGELVGEASRVVE